MAKAKVVSKKMTEKDADRLIAVLTAAEVEGIEKIKENGTFVRTRPAYRCEPNARKRSAKMSAIVIGRTSVSRLRARSRFSNCPPHSTR